MVQQINYHFTYFYFILEKKIKILFQKERERKLFGIFLFSVFQKNIKKISKK